MTTQLTSKQRAEIDRLEAIKPSLEWEHGPGACVTARWINSRSKIAEVEINPLGHPVAMRTLEQPRDVPTRRRAA